MLEKTNKLAPNALEIHWRYAVALAHSGEWQCARNELDRLLASGRDFPCAKTAARACSKA